jgi:CRP-like cAMP-binding protein
VTEITWRATVLRTKTGNSITVPNNIISKEAILNFSKPQAPTRLQVEVGIDYGAPPNKVKAVMLDALRDAPLVQPVPPPDVVIAEFGASAVLYHVRFWIADYQYDAAARDQVLSSLHYALRRASLEIPCPIQLEYRRELVSSPMVTPDRRLACVDGVDIFAGLSPEDRARLADSSDERLFGSGQAIVREGEAGSSMFLLVSGRVRVCVGHPPTEVATIGPGGFFGEMSLLTGEPRTATVSAIEDCLLVEVGAEDFRAIALANPSVVDRVGLAVAERRAGLARTRTETATVDAAPEAPRSFLARVQQFLGLPVH